ncbi:MAG TPA: cytochrome c oxidase subunit 3 family protein [Thermoanaerobaculia bacterium]|nr:cytochrome c oxidase subunit 3 family protein [Thermoanaerobaculia bacterium]
MSSSASAAPASPSEIAASLAKAGVHDHHPALQHHFDTLAQQKESATLGMWMFLVTEVLFFGGLFATYVIYRLRFPGVFAEASHKLNVIAGGFNTAVLICSSLTMALAIRSAQVDRRKAIVFWLILTVFLGSTFLGVKAYEYHHKYVEHLWPFTGDFDRGEFTPGHGRAAQIFFSLYFVMTGIHALHMVIGIGLLIWLMFPSWRGRFDSTYHNPLEMTGLYWHFVDIVWIFLFPLLYLLGAHAR